MTDISAWTVWMAWDYPTDRQTQTGQKMSCNEID